MSSETVQAIDEALAHIAAARNVCACVASDLVALAEVLDCNPYTSDRAGFVAAQLRRKAQELVGP